MRELRKFRERKFHTHRDCGKKEALNKSEEKIRVKRERERERVLKTI